MEEQKKITAKKIKCNNSFWKTTFAVLLGGILLFFLLIGVVSIIIGAATSEDPVSVEPNSILKLTLQGQIGDRGKEGLFGGMDNAGSQFESIIGLNDILSCLKKAEKDENIAGVYLNLSSINSGIATLQEIRNAILDFKKSGKFVVSYGSYFDQKAYYLASVADEIYLNPEGLIVLKGLSAQLMFFKRLLDKIGVEAQVIRHGKFKSAVEPLIQETISEDNRLQTETFVKSIWGSIVEGISKERNISVEELNLFADSLFSFDPNKALDNKLVDKLMYEDQVLAELKERVKIKEKDDLELISLGKYKKVPAKKEGGLAKDRIAVIYATGEIISGKGDDQIIGDEGIIKEIRRARDKKSVKAIVLRINSPGGSALASENIWREIMLAKKEKPIIASMGDVAASGGYYIACAADTIVANNTTITGSIGVFGVFFNSRELLTDNLGITFHNINTNEYSDYGTISRSIKDTERRVTQNSVEKVYQTFISHVSEGRGITTEEVDEIGQGRVWSGSDAKDRNLTDVAGGLREALEIAKEMAGLEKYRVLELPEQKDPLEEIIDGITGKQTEIALQKELGVAYKYYKQVKALTNYEGIQTRLPFIYEIK